MSHYSHKNIPDAKLDFGNFSIFGDTTSQYFTLKRETNHQIRVCTPGKWI